MPEDTIVGFRLSAQQERLWAQQQIFGVTHFKSQCAISLTGVVEPSKLSTALSEVVARHEILRTVFQRQPGLKIPFQVILQTLAIDFQRVDLSALEWAGQKQELERLLNQPHLAGDNLENGPILEASLIRLGFDHSALVLRLPALSSDRHALETLVEALGQHYAGAAPREDFMQYADVVEWQRELRESEETKAGRNFWGRYCRKIHCDVSTALPMASKAEATIFCPALFERELASQLASEIKTESARLDATVKELLFAAFNVLVWRLAGVHAAIGCGMDGRKYQELEGTVGLLDTFLPLQVEFASDASFQAIVRQTHRTYGELAEWQESFSWDWAKENSASESPMLPLLFEFTRRPDSKSYGNVVISWLNHYSLIEAFLLKLVAVDTGCGLSLEFHYDSSRLS
ncbi:MAG: hypothetical protein JO266_16940, partial [Acidobacteria bacterium]|nr:hypothetical protein [Acidobacteriota bacterium]